MRYLSLFSGIEAASAAWAPLGWECVGVSEIEPFPCSVLAQRHPGVPNLGDITKITETDIVMLGQIDLVVFGSPCQDLSVAGKRKGLDGERSGLFFAAMQIVEWARVWGDCRFAIWENVPGAFSSNAGDDFGVVVGQMAGMECAETPPKGWGPEGAIVGPQGMVEWAVLDAQWFGVAQRRRRVFAIADFGDWASRPPILLEPESLRGDSAPSREAGQSVAGTLASRTGAGGYPGTDEACSGHVICSDVSPTLDQRAGRSGANSFATSGGLIGLQRSVLGKKWPADVACTLDTTYGTKQGLEDQHVNSGCPLFVPYAHVDCMPTLRAGAPSSGTAGHGARSGDCKDEYIVPCVTGPITHTLKAEGFDASEDGTGRGTPIVPVIPFDTTQITSPLNYSNPKAGDPCHPLAATAHVPAVAYSTKLHNTQSNQAGKIYEEYTVALDRSSPPPALLTAMQVRRLTPRECERLQAFPDDHTLITVRGKPAADGPRYKALGNSMCVNVMAWIGKQIDHVVLFY